MGTMPDGDIEVGPRESNRDGRRNPFWIAAA